jgi:hypothetical protein
MKRPDRQPAEPPAALLHGQLRDQRHRDETGHLRHRGDRGREGAAGDEPIVQGAIDRKLERAGPNHPGHAEQQIKDEQRLGQRQQHHRRSGHEHCERQCRA